MTKPIILAVLFISGQLTSSSPSQSTCPDGNLDDPVSDVSFLQVNQNITETKRMAMNSLAHAPENASQVLQKATNGSMMSLALTERYLSTAQATSGWGVVLDIIIVVLVIILMVACCTTFFRRTPQSDPFLVKDGPGGQAASLLTSQAVPVPVLCKDFVLKNSETRFTIGMTNITDPSASSPSFPINLPTGKKVLEASVTDGGMLSFLDVNSARQMMVRASSSADKMILTLYDGPGAYYGKVAPGPDGNGVVVYHLQAPCAIVRATDLSGLCVDIQSLTDRRNVIARSFRKGDELRVQVFPNYDGVLLLACLLGIIVLEPKLMEQALK
mmetsp:Transcript_60770/g.113630  ORF Transcript_60770/g.113630 Transcript_60770/m.113630 type:complete len:328 (+) Transcript_60770:52-1035(+)